MGESIEILAGYFRSGNSIPCERATIPATKWNEFVSAYSSETKSLREELEKTRVRDSGAKHYSVGHCIVHGWNGKQSDDLLAVGECPACDRERIRKLEYELEKVTRERDTAIRAIGDNAREAVTKELKAVKAERERCAKIAENMDFRSGPAKFIGYRPLWDGIRFEIAKAIRGGE